MKKFVKYCIIISIIILLIVLLNERTIFAISNPGEEINNFFNTSSDSVLIEKTATISGTFLTVFKVVGTGIAVIMLIVLAMKYMLAAPGDKATIKKHAVVYIVGAICLFAATGIITILEKVSTNLK